MNQLDTIPLPVMEKVAGVPVGATPTVVSKAAIHADMERQYGDEKMTLYPTIFATPAHQALWFE